MDACLGMSEMGSHSRNERVRKTRSLPENGTEEVSCTKHILHWKISILVQARAGIGKFYVKGQIVNIRGLCDLCCS